MADGTLNKKAIFSDGTADFVSPCEPRVYETVTVRCRVGKDEAEYVKAMVDEVPYIMHLEKSTEYFDIYAVSFPLEDHPISYYFRVETAKETIFQFLSDSGISYTGLGKRCRDVPDFCGSFL